MPIYSCSNWNLLNPFGVLGSCGGYQLSIRLETGGNNCSTWAKDFYSGEDLTWSGSQLGNCQGFPVNSRTRINLHTDDSNEYAVFGYLIILADCNLYRARIPTTWRNWGHNWKTYGITFDTDFADFKRKVDEELLRSKKALLILLLSAEKFRGLADMLSWNRKPWCT